MKRAIITGITGQDGSYLSKYLLNQQYIVFGLVRSKITNDLWRLRFLEIIDKIELVECDLSDISQVSRLIQILNPDEIYHLAAQSSVSISFTYPTATINYNIISTLNLLEAIRLTHAPLRFYQASTSEMFGAVSSLPINGETVIYPRSPYAISKATGYWITRNYRDSFKIYATSGILFNHESALRQPSFVVKKIISTALDIQQGKADKLILGNIDVRRDFGYAPSYVQAMWRIMQQDTPDDFMICSGFSTSIREIVEIVFGKLGIPLSALHTEQSLYRPAEIAENFGDPEKAKQVLKWRYDFTIPQLIDQLISDELEVQDFLKFNK
jgi:GDPmannose 4,6-dehydratase